MSHVHPISRYFQGQRPIRTFRILVGVVIKGLLHSLKKIVMSRDPKTIEDFRKLVCIRERTLLETVTAPGAAADTSDTATLLTVKLEEVIYGCECRASS